jgi:hypothetical protein
MDATLQRQVREIGVILSTYVRRSFANTSSGGKIGVLPDKAEEEFMILAEGAGIWNVAGKQSAARKGDVLYAAPWTLHGRKNTSDAHLLHGEMEQQGREAARKADRREMTGVAGKPTI